MGALSPRHIMGSRNQILDAVISPWDKKCHPDSIAGIMVYLAETKISGYNQPVLALKPLENHDLLFGGRRTCCCSGAPNQQLEQSFHITHIGGYIPQLACMEIASTFSFCGLGDTFENVFLGVKCAMHKLMCCMIFSSPKIHKQPHILPLPQMTF